MSEYKHAEYVRKIVAEAPPLTPHQRDVIYLAFAGMRKDSPVAQEEELDELATIRKASKK